MYAPMTYKEFATLRKLANKAKKCISDIGECNERETWLEEMSLQALREIAADLLNTANEIYAKYN